MRAPLLLCLGLAAGCLNPAENWRSEAPPVSDVAVFHPVAATPHTLANGVGVWVSTLEHSATTRVALVVGRGHTDRHPAPGSARVLARWLELEAQAAQSKSFDALGVDLRVKVDATTTRLEVDVLNADVPQAMAAIAALVHEANDEAAFESARGRQLVELARLRRSPDRLAVSAAMQAMLGPQHAHLDPEGVGSEPAVQRLHFQDILAARETWTARATATWVVVGPHETATVRSWAWTVSKTWPQREDPLEDAVVPPVRRGTVTLVPFAGLDPAVVVVVKPLRDTHQRTSTETAFSAGVGFAHAQLRERAQRTYGVRGRLVDDGPVHAAVAVTRVPTADAVRAAATIVGSFRAVAPYVDDLPVSRARRSESTSWTAASMETDVRAHALYRALAGGAPLDAVPPFGPLPRQPSASRVRHALQTEFLPEDFHIVLAGDPQVIEAQLRGTEFRVRTDVDLVGPSTLPDDL